MMKQAIEAVGVRGMKATSWRKTFTSVEALNAWVERNDSVVVDGVRELEQDYSAGRVNHELNGAQ